MKFLVGLFLSATAVTNAVAQASLTCSNGYGYTGVPTLNITYYTGGDAGKVGLTFLGVLSQDQTVGAVLNMSDGWIPYEGGLYPPHRRYDSGMPGTVTVNVPFPKDAYGNQPNTTSAWVGYSIYMGHGFYTTEAQRMVSTRRTYLNSIKADKQAKGTWRSEYDDDNLFMWSLVQKNMTDNGKYGHMLTIPYLNCGYSGGGGGGGFGGSGN
jgi:hypothetical protein